jgi:hypothetical protein
MLVAEVMAKSGEAVKSGPIGFAVILVLCVVCYFLFKSMSKHLKSVREGFPSDAKPAEPETQAESVAADEPTPATNGSAADDGGPPA